WAFRGAVGRSGDASRWPPPTAQGPARSLTPRPAHIPTGGPVSRPVRIPPPRRSGTTASRGIYEDVAAGEPVSDLPSRQPDHLQLVVVERQPEVVFPVQGEPNCRFRDFLTPELPKTSGKTEIGSQQYPFEGAGRLRRHR